MRCQAYPPRPSSFASCPASASEPDTVTWTTTCPLACLEILAQYQRGDVFRRYPKWNGKRFLPCHNVADPVKFGIDWLVLQGACEGERFDHNAGRKSLAGWCGHLHVAYEESFQIHGDQTRVVQLECFWKDCN